MSPHSGRALTHAAFRSLRRTRFAVPVVTRALPVRARVAARPEPRAERLYDALTDDLVRGGPLARERFATIWSDTDALRRLADAKRAPLPPELAREMTEQHRRLGASPASLAALGQLARGEAVCAIAGQQPAPLGGPLYSLHKIASTIGLAARFTARTGMPCVPVFWMHGEDSDFEEIRSATLSDATLSLKDFTLPASAHREAGLVGGIALEPLLALERDASACWAGRPGAADVDALLARSHAGARDLGEAYAALVLAMFAEQGVVAIDPRLPSFVAAARGVIDRYLAAPGALAAAARNAGERLEASGGRRALNDAALESFVFRVEDGVRHKVSPSAAAAAPRLSPSVALRPAVQDGVLPTVAMACGPGEIAYLAQLREVFEGVGVRAACAAPRFGATWLPAAAGELLAATGADPWEMVTGVDAVLRAHADAQVPADVRAALERAHREAVGGLADFGAVAAQVDASLPQMVESARAKVDFQFQRLIEGVVGKMRHRLERRHPEWPRLRYYLLPGEKLQERRLSGVELVASRGAGVAAELAELATEHAARLETGVHEHVLLDLA